MTKDIKSILESLIFVVGKPISIKKLAKIVNIKESQVKNVLNELRQDYQGRGIKILARGNAVLWRTVPIHSQYVKELLTEELQENLTRAALETLAIIAYRGPVTRSQIEQVRGVNSVYILRNLLMRGLIDRERSKKDARFWEYQPSFDFLRHLGIKDVKELPDFEELYKEEMPIEKAEKLTEEKKEESR